MRTHIVHMTEAQNSPSAPAGESYRIWRVDSPRPLAHEGGSSAAVRVSRLREYHVFDQNAEARAGIRSLHRAVPLTEKLGLANTQHSPRAPQGQDKPVRSQEHDHPALGPAPLRLRPAKSSPRLSPL